MRTFWVPPTLRGYRRAWLGADALAALTLVAVALPSQMATARLAGLPAVVGLYAFLAGSLFYALLGTKPHLSVGADSTIAPVLATAATAVAVAGSAGYATTMAFMALVVGALLIAVGLLRLGWISDFLSTPVITGLLAGIGVEIVVRQLPVVLGVKGGGTTTIGRLVVLSGQVGQTNGWCVGLAVGVLAFIVIAQRTDHRLPGTLVALIASIVAVHVFALASHHGVAVIGPVHGGLPHISLPSAAWSHVRLLVAPVLTVAFVCIAQTAATVRESGAEVAAPNDFNRDLIGVGAGSLAAGLVGSFAVDASPPNTAIVSASGSRSQLTNVMAALIVLLVVLVATGPIRQLPEATLGATLVFIATKLFRAGNCGPSCGSTASSSPGPFPPSLSWPLSASNRAWPCPCSCRSPTAPGGPPGPRTLSSGANPALTIGSRLTSARPPRRWRGSSSTSFTPRFGTATPTTSATAPASW